jgi:succinoglycan biosynthesis transport protein ExoP
VTKQPPSAREQLDRMMVLLRRSRSFWRRGLVVFLVGALLAVPFVLTRARSYRSETIILYQETIRSSDVTGGEPSSESSRRVGARLHELLLTRTTLEPIITDLHLYTNSIVRGELVGAVEEMRKNIAFQAREGDTYQIAFTGDTPQEAQEVTRRLGDCILHESETRRSDQAKTLKEFLSKEAARNEAELRQKEADLTRFVVLHPEFALRLQGLPPTATTGAGATSAPGTDPVLAGLEARAARIQRQLGAKPSTAPPKPSPTFQPPPDSPELVAARRNLADKLTLYTDKHPDVIAARERVRAAEDAQAALNDAAAAAFAAQQGDGPPPQNASDVAALKKQLAVLQAQIAARRRMLSGAPATATPDPSAIPEAQAPAEFELEFRRLQREVSDGRDRQQQLEERLFRASIAESSIMDDRNVQVSVLDPPYLPIRPVSKPRSLLLAALLIVCLLIGVATAFVSATLDDRLHDRHDVERLDLLPLLAVIPKPPVQEIRRLPPRSDPVEGPR